MIKIRIAVMLLLALLSLLTYVLSTRWNAWFRMPPEAAYRVPGEPDRIVLTYGADALHQRTISWRCGVRLKPSEVQIADTRGGDTLTLPAAGRLVNSRGGRQAFYHLRLLRLRLGTTYSYRVTTAGRRSPWLNFSTAGSGRSLQFLLFGDIQDEPGGSSNALFAQARRHRPEAQFWAFVGDVVERPDDGYWNLLFSALGTVAGRTPLLMSTGNHEYVKGFRDSLDARWISTFVFPHNGDSRHAGRNYYVDFPLLRYIALDTQGLQTPPDYWLTYRWLSKVLSTNHRYWVVVVMHHPVYSGKPGRDNMFLRWLFRPLFERYKVDLVAEGHDHSYARRSTWTTMPRLGPWPCLWLTDAPDHKATTPMYVICNSSAKCYLSNCDPQADRICSGHALYQCITMTDSTLHLQAFLSGSDSLYDDVVLHKDRNGISIANLAGHLPEIVDSPAHLGRTKSAEFRALKARRFAVRSHAVARR